MMPTARDLGISARHRRALMREAGFQTMRRCLNDCLRDRADVREREVVGGIVLVTHDADKVRESLTGTARRFHDRAVEYLTRRARGESAKQIRDDWYGA